MLRKIKAIRAITGANYKDTVNFIETCGNVESSVEIDSDLLQVLCERRDNTLRALTGDNIPLLTKVELEGKLAVLKETIELVVLIA